jgi:hypothetical protein
MLAGFKEPFSEHEMNAVRALMAGAIDYAGLFPPASLHMVDAVRNYARYQRGPDAWALGNFIVPLDRLEEFDAAAAGLGLERRVTLSAVLPSPRFDSARLAAGLAFGYVASAEVRVSEAAEVGEVASLASPGITNYFEIPLSGNRVDLLDAIAEEGERAKLRTGGTQRGSIPSPLDVSQFLFECFRARVAFKATAGLHHAIRGTHALTNDENSPEELMHGFLNVLLAAALAFEGRNAESVLGLLEETSPGAFRFNNSGVEWRGLNTRIEILKRTREEFAIAFGSCSFEEPLGELRSLGLI